MPTLFNHTEYMRKYYSLNKSKWQERHKVTYKRDREKILAERREYYRKNRDRILIEGRAKREAYRRAWRANNPEKVKAQIRRHNHTKRLKKLGLTNDQFESLKESQNGTCAICGSIGNNGLHLDHDHQTNKVRGLLCCKCNLGLGYFNDDPRLLAEAINYVVPKKERVS